MRKILSLMTMLFVVSMSSNLYGKDLFTQLGQDISRATKCLPEIKKGQVKFCTGFSVPLTDIKKFSKKEMSDCLLEIERNSYKVVKEGKHKEIGAALWQSFYKSTKNAETLHSSGLVLFKKNASAVECLHELVHVWQWKKSTFDSLSPQVRKSNLEKAKQELLKETEIVAQLEKKGQRKRAISKGKQVQKKINLLNEYSQLPSWLDEKDAYYILFRACDDFLRCNQDDHETILANLFKMSSKLPSHFRSVVYKQSQELVRKKEEKLLTRVRIKKLSKSQNKMIKQWLGMNMQELISSLNKQKVSVISMDKSNFTDLSGFTPIEEKEDFFLKHKLNPFKQTKKNILGRYFCDSESKENLIVLYKGANYFTLLHEAIHFLQSQNNVTYCNSLVSQPRILEVFSRGELSREDYENAVLRMKILNWKAEEQAYQISLDHGFGTTDSDILNNKIQKVFYSTLTNRYQHSSRPYRIRKNIEIKFVEKDGIPFVKTNLGMFAFDTGAMDSVISPKVFFDHNKVSSVKTLKMKSIQKADGSKVDAPLVFAKRSSLNIQASKLKDSKSLDLKIRNKKWLLANLGLKDIQGILGFDLLAQKDFIIYPKELKIVFPRNMKRPDRLSFDLDSTKENRSIIFQCGSFKIRIDSASAVEGDLNPDLKNHLIKCGGLNVQGKFKSAPHLRGLFTNEVDLNLGWPWLKKFQAVMVSNKRNWIAFIKKN